LQNARARQLLWLGQGGGSHAGRVQVEPSMKRYPWLKLLKKSRQEPELEPPLWLGDHSNGEYYHRQTPRERLIRKLILERADEGARKHGIERRQFLASSMGMATSLAVINYVAGCSSGSKNANNGGGAGGMSNPAASMGSGGRSSNGSGGATGSTGSAGGGAGGASGAGGSSASGSGGMMSMADAGGAGADHDAGDAGGRFNTGDPMDPECTAAKMLNPDDVFVFDLQTHHIDRVGNDSYTQFFNLGYPEQSSCGKGLPGCFLQDEYIDLMFMQSHTAIAMLSAVPAVENELPIKNDEMAMSRDYINQLAHSQRVVIQGQVLPNNGLQQQLDGMQRLVEEQKIICWKVHTEWGPNNVWGNAPDGYWLDDMDVGIPFVEKARSTGVKTFCCHKGLPAPLFNSDHCSPRDIGPIAKAYPDTNWVVYHSGFGFGALIGGTIEGAYQDGSMTGIDSTITVLKGSGIGPNENVYAEVGGVWNTVMTDPTQAAHVIGKLLLYVGEDNLLWGSDAIWTAKPQPYVDAFWNFEITPQFQMQYGYPELTQDLKRKILGLNSAKLFNIDVSARRCEIDKGAMAYVKRTREGELGPLYWAGARPLGPTTRREFFRLSKWREFLKIPG
jgi:predicted TIM-barrel fold metal-dependent hydrolase